MIQLTPKQSYLLLGGAIVVSGAVGYLIGYKMGNKNLAQETYDDLYDGVQDEIEAARIHYARLYKRDEFSSPSKLVDTDPPVYAEGEEEELDTIVRQYQTDDQTPTVVNVTNVFVNGQPLDEDFDYEAEQAKRDEDPDKPYVISHEEFMQNEPEYNQVTLTYFEGDGILADERDDTIDDEDETVGTDNLSRFGHGSNDNNVVYVRNTRLDLDFEIVKSTGSYAEEVAGLRHYDDTVKLRKFRLDD